MHDDAYFILHCIEDTPKGQYHKMSFKFLSKLY